MYGVGRTMKYNAASFVIKHLECFQTRAYVKPPSKIPFL